MVVYDYENFFRQENLSLRSLFVFSDKILKLHTALKTFTTKFSPHTLLRDTPSLNSFAPVTVFDSWKIPWSILDLVRALVISRVDYSNSALSGVSDHVLNRLLSVLNAAARLVCSKRRHYNIAA